MLIQYVQMSQMIQAVNQGEPLHAAGELDRTNR